MFLPATLPHKYNLSTATVYKLARPPAIDCGPKQIFGVLAAGVEHTCKPPAVSSPLKRFDDGQT